MKYETFRKIRIVAIIGAIIGGLALLFSQCGKSRRQQEPPPQYQNPPHTSAPSQRPQMQAPIPKPSYGSNELPMTATDSRILDMQKGTTSSGKPDENGLKQSVTTSDFKLDMRSDTKKGYSYWNRVKVDYNMNHKWDEKWSFGKDGTIKREVAPSDDENYTMTYVLKGNVWVKR